jgi:hypothetical protein
MNILKALEDYDIKRLKTRCNFKNCKKKPGKEILIYEFDRITSKRRDLISLYLCSTHYKNAEKALPEKLESLKSGGKIIKGKVFNIGMVTH